MPSTRSKPKPKSKLHHQWSFEAIGTQWWIGIYQPVAELERLKAKVAARIEVFDAAYSRFRPDSLVTAMSKRAGAYNLPQDAKNLLAFYYDLYKATDGKVTPLVGQLLEDAGYDAAYTLQPKTLRPVPGWDEVMLVQGSTVELQRPIMLDFGAAGKGYLIDLLAELMRGSAVQQFCIDASGDVFCVGLDEPLRIGLEHPADPTLAIGVAAISGQALCASAPNRRQWAGVHHIMDPVERQPVNDIVAVWTVAETTMLADGLATALFFTPPEKLQQFSFQYVILYANGRAQYSPHWPGELFS